VEIQSSRLPQVAPSWQIVGPFRDGFQHPLMVIWGMVYDALIVMVYGIGFATLAYFNTFVGFLSIIHSRGLPVYHSYIVYRWIYNGVTMWLRLRCGTPIAVFAKGLFCRFGAEASEQRGEKTCTSGSGGVNQASVKLGPKQAKQGSYDITWYAPKKGTTWYNHLFLDFRAGDSCFAKHLNNQWCSVRPFCHISQ